MVSHESGPLDSCFFKNSTSCPKRGLNAHRGGATDAGGCREAPAGRPRARRQPLPRPPQASGHTEPRSRRLPGPPRSRPPPTTVARETTAPSPRATHAVLPVSGSLGGRSLCTAHDRTWDEHVVTAWAPAAPGTPGPARTGRLSAGDTAFRAAGPAPQAARAPWHRPHSLFPEGPAFRSGHTHCPLLAQAPGPRSCLTRNPGSRGPCGPTVGPALLPPAGLPCSPSPVPPRAAPALFVSCL